MNIGEVKERIKNLPDNMLFCGKGHYGEILQIYDVYQTLVREGDFAQGKKHKAMVVSMQDAGPEPD